MDIGPLRIVTPDAPDVELVSGRLLMRRFGANDSLLLTELDSDPEVKRFIDDGAPPRPELDREAIARIRRQYVEFPGLGCLPRTGSIPANTWVGFIFARTAKLPAILTLATG
jgi:hypothetical protein